MRPSIPLTLVGLLLALPGHTQRDDAQIDRSRTRVASVAGGVNGHLTSGNVAGIYGERQIADPGSVGGSDGGARGNANLPGNQLPVNLRVNASAPPGMTEASSGGGLFATVSSGLGRISNGAREWWSPSTPKTVENPSFEREVCSDGNAPGQSASCSVQVMMMRENTPYAARITDFVEYGEVGGTVFREKPWWQFWKKAPSPSGSDVQQGGIGDCSLLASLAAVANKEPDLLKKMIKIHKSSKAAWVQFYSGDPAQPVMVGPVDKRFPVYRPGLSNAGESAFAKPIGEPPPPIWPLIIEKAYALQFNSGSYGELNEGVWPHVVLTHLTGRPSEHIAMNPNDSGFQREIEFAELAAWDRAGMPLVMSTRNPMQGGCRTAIGPSSTGEFDNICTDPLYQGKLACAPGSTDPVCALPEAKIVKLASPHAYWVKSLDPATQTVTLANPWGPEAPLVSWPWSRLRKSMQYVYINKK